MEEELLYQAKIEKMKLKIEKQENQFIKAIMLSILYKIQKEHRTDGF